MGFHKPDFSMKPKKRQKLCHNCEGEIDVDVIVCPFCAADLREEKPEQLHPPAYNPSASLRNLNNQQTNQSLYPSSSQRVVEQPEIQDEVVAAVPEETEEKEKNIFAPMILFTLGVQLCIFGLLMLLFSHKGVITLKWDARFWFFYVFASVPFLVFGYRALSKL